MFENVSLGCPGHEESGTGLAVSDDFGNGRMPGSRSSAQGRK